MRMERIARTARTSRFRRTSPFPRRLRVQRTPRGSRASRIQHTSRGSRTSRIHRTSRGSRTSRYSLTSRLFERTALYTYVASARAVDSPRGQRQIRSALLTPATVGAAAPADGRRGVFGAPRASRHHLSVLHATGHLLFTSDKRTCITPLVTAFTTSRTGIVHPKPHTVASLISSRSNVPKK